MELDANNSGKTFSDVFAGQVRLIFLDKLVFASVVIENAGQCGTETGKVATSVYGIDTVSKADDRIGETIVVLECRLNYGVVDRFRDINRLSVADRPVTVKVTHEAGDPALKEEGIFAVAPLVSDGYFQLFIQEGEQRSGKKHLLCYRSVPA